MIRPARLPTPGDLERCDRPDTSLTASLSNLVDALQRYRDRCAHLERQVWQQNIRLDTQRLELERLKARNLALTIALSQSHIPKRRRKAVSPGQRELPLWD